MLVGRAENGAEACWAVAKDAALHVAVLGETEEDGREQLGEGGVCAGEGAEVTRWKEICDFKNNFEWNSEEGHRGGDDIEGGVIDDDVDGDDVDGVVVGVVPRV